MTGRSSGSGRSRTSARCCSANHHQQPSGRCFRGCLLRFPAPPPRLVILLLLRFSLTLFRLRMCEHPVLPFDRRRRPHPLQFGVIRNEPSVVTEVCVVVPPPLIQVAEVQEPKPCNPSHQSAVNSRRPASPSSLIRRSSSGRSCVPAVERQGKGGVLAAETARSNAVHPPSSV